MVPSFFTYMSPWPLGISLPENEHLGMTSPCFDLLGFPIRLEEDDDHAFLDRPFDVPQDDPARIRAFQHFAEDLVDLAVDACLGANLHDLRWVSFWHQNHFFSGFGSFLSMSWSFSFAPPAFSTATAEVPTSIPIATPSSFLVGTKA